MTYASWSEAFDTCTEVLIRRAHAADAERIGETRVRAWQAAYSASLPAEFLSALDPGANLDRLRQLLNSDAPLPIVTVAEVDGIVRGFSILGAPRSSASSAALELWALNIHPNYWRAGLATRLVMQITQIHPTTDIELWCLQGNLAAEALYQRCGFHKTGEERCTRHLTGHPLTECRFVREPVSDAP
jgi:RimJ/RimL family protein N-acetyltransferase